MRFRPQFAGAENQFGVDTNVQSDRIKRASQGREARRSPEKLGFRAQFNVKENQLGGEAGREGEDDQ